MCLRSTAQAWLRTVSFLSVSLSICQLPLCSACSFTVTGKRNSFCSTGEENLQTLETVVVPHATLNSMVFSSQPERAVMCPTPFQALSSLKTLDKIHQSLISEKLSSEKGSSAGLLVGLVFWGEGFIAVF